MRPVRMIIAASLTLGLWAVTATAGHAQSTPSPAPVATPAAASAIADSQTPPPPPPPPPAAPNAPAARKVQQPPPAAAPKAPPEPPPPPARPRSLGQLINVRVEVTVTDQASGKPPVSRTLSVTVADGENAQVRSNLEIPSGGRFLPTGFQLDAQPRIVSRLGEGPRRDAGPAGSAGDALIRLGLILDYNSTDSGTATGDAGSGRSSPSSIRVRQEVILESGKPLVIAQPVDAMSDRKVTVEVKATILR